jgi:hypothetical protein
VESGISTALCHNFVKATIVYAYIDPGAGFGHVNCVIFHTITALAFSWHHTVVNSMPKQFNIVALAAPAHSHARDYQARSRCLHQTDDKRKR